VKGGEREGGKRHKDQGARPKVSPSSIILSFRYALTALRHAVFALYPLSSAIIFDFVLFCYFGRDACCKSKLKQTPKTDCFFGEEWLKFL